jgi:triosephosphate isomerase
MRKKIVAANWKMNMTAGEAADYYEAFRLEIEELQGVEIVLAPPFTALPKLSELLGGSQKVRLGAQNFYHEKPGAYTGEISAGMLRELFVRYVIIGHSERRQILNRKVRAAHANELKPILCVGETLAEREQGKVEAVIERQLRAGLAGCSEEELMDTVIAYEPIWAIGTGVNASPAEAQEAHACARSVLAAIGGETTASKMRIQYGGSVKPGNAAELMSQPDIDGALVGGASLDPRGFAQIVAAGIPE